MSEFREALRGRVDEAPSLPAAPSSESDRCSRCSCVATLDTQVEADLGPFRTAVELITSIPGVKNLGAHVIVSEVGIDMSRFRPHISSRGLAYPRNDESAGKRRSNRLRKGAPWLKTTLVQCAWAAVKRKNSYLQAQFYRIKAWRGPKKADHGRRSLHPYRYLPHAQGWDDVQGPRLQSLRSPFNRQAKNNAWLNASLNLGTLWRSSRIAA